MLEKTTLSTSQQQLASDTLIIWQLEAPLRSLSAVLNIDPTDLAKAIHYKDDNPIKMFLHIHISILLTRAKIYELQDQLWKSRNLLIEAEQVARDAKAYNLSIQPPDFNQIRTQINFATKELEAKQHILDKLEEDRRNLSHQLSQDFAKIKQQIQEFLAQHHLLMTEAEIDKGIKDTMLEVKARSAKGPLAKIKSNKTTIDKKSKQYRFDGVMRYLEGVAATEVISNVG